MGRCQCVVQISYSLLVLLRSLLTASRLDRCMPREVPYGPDLPRGWRCEVLNGMDVKRGQSQRKRHMDTRREPCRPNLWYHR